MSFFEPVRVGANINILRTATNLESYTNEDNIQDPERLCSICQQNYTVGSIIRKINHCKHYYHQNCLDQWFENNVKCPECQYDIRTTQPTTTQPTTAQSSTTQQTNRNIENSIEQLIANIIQSRNGNSGNTDSDNDLYTSNVSSIDIIIPDLSLGSILNRTNDINGRQNIYSTLHQYNNLFRTQQQTQQPSPNFNQFMTHNLFRNINNPTNQSNIPPTTTPTIIPPQQQSVNIPSTQTTTPTPQPVNIPSTPNQQVPTQQTVIRRTSRYYPYRNETRDRDIESRLSNLIGRLERGINNNNYDDYDSDSDNDTVSGNENNNIILEKLSSLEKKIDLIELKLQKEENIKKENIKTEDKKKKSKLKFWK